MAGNGKALLHPHAIEHEPIALAGGRETDTVTDDSPAVLPTLRFVPTDNYKSRTPQRVRGQRQRRIAPLRLARITLTGIMALLLAGLLGWGMLALNDPGTLPLKSVRIEGEFTRVSTEQLQQALATVVTGGFLNVDVDAIRRAAERLPWVSSARVRRVWPDTVRVTVSEKQAIARWGEQGLISANAEIFVPAPQSHPPGLPELHGPQGTQKTLLEHYRTLNQALATLGLSVARLQLDERRAWRLTLNNGAELVLGHNETGARMERFLRVYPTLAAQEFTVERIDLRYTNGFAVRTGTTQESVAPAADEEAYAGLSVPVGD